MRYSDIEIDWVGEIRAYPGYGIQARRILQPLIEGGAKVKLIPNEDYIPEERRIQDPYWMTKIEGSKAMPDSPIRVNFAIPPLYKLNPNALNIGYTMWETTQYPREWVPAINQLDRFFVGSDQLISSATAAGIKVPIHVQTSTMDISKWGREGGVLQVSELPENCIKILFIGNWIPRKNYEDLITGYVAAFDGVEDVALVIKTWTTGDVASRGNIEAGVRHIANKMTGIKRPKISLIMDILPEEQIIALMRSCHIYASVAHGEGFDLPMVQAMSVGNLVVSTRFLGHADYLKDDNCIPVNYSLTPVTGANAPHYDGYQMWSRPDMKSYVDGLRHAYTLVKSKMHTPYIDRARDTVAKLYDVETNTEHLAELMRKIKHEGKTSKQLFAT